MEEKHKALFIVGGPGSGKGTICDYLIDTYGFKHFSTGDLLRAEVKSGSELGKNIDALISKGNLVPGHISVDLLRKNILRLSLDQICLIDGFPRNQDNIDNWNNIIADEVHILGCIYLDCKEEVMKDRILN
jgi:adenylate kinase family enzyme